MSGRTTTDDSMDQATALGRRIAAKWRESVSSLIGACVDLAKGVRDFGDDRRRFIALLEPLVTARMITRNDLRLGRGSPRVSMLLKIAAWKEVFLHDDVLPFLDPEPTVLYDAANLGDQIAETDGKDKARAAVMALLRDRPTREQLQEEARRRKNAGKNDQRGLEPAAGASGDAPPRATLGGIIAAEQRYDLAVLTPDPQQTRLLATDDEGSGLLPFLPIVRALAEQSAAAIVVAPAVKQLAVAQRVLNACGFGRPAHVIETGPRESSVTTDAMTLVVAERGGMRAALPAVGERLAYAGPADALKIAAGFYPNAKRRFHGFAPNETGGWTCLIANDTWLEIPSLQ